MRSALIIFIFCLISGLISWPLYGEVAVSVISPKEGQKIVGTSLTVVLKASGVTIKPADGTRVHSEGHFVLYLDREPEFSLEPVPLEDGIVHTAESRYTFTDLTPGEHTLTVVLADGMNIPFEPPVMATVQFAVAAVNVGQRVLLWLLVGLGLVLLGFLILRRRYGR